MQTEINQKSEWMRMRCQNATPRESARLGLESKIVLITGAARGIGRAAAVDLAEAGATVIACDVDEDELSALEVEISEGGGKAVSLSGDLTDRSFPERLITTATEYGGLDVLINNAGYTWDNVIQKSTDEQFLAMLEIHSVVPFRLLRAALPAFRAGSQSESADRRIRMKKVVNVTSISAIDGNPGQAAYSAGKAAVIGLTRTLAKEWGRYNINVNAVAFGLVDTRLTGRVGDSPIHVAGRDIPVGMKEDMREQIVCRIPLQRFGTAVEAAGAILFLCSSLSDYVTGEVLICSGGLHF